MEEALTIIVIYQIAVFILGAFVSLILGMIDDIEEVSETIFIVSFMVLIVLGIILILYKVG